MKLVKKNNSLFEIAPYLVKEWHPTINGDLTPRNLEVDYPKKVWWICSESHEWQATIKDRRNQKGCPICENGGKEVADETLSFPMKSKNRRKNKRFKTNAIVVIEVPTSGHWIYADIKNFSPQGLCIETDSVIRPGSAVIVKFEKDIVSSRLEKSPISHNTNGFKTYNSTVKWYRQFNYGQSNSSTNIGLEFN